MTISGKSGDPQNPLGDLEEWDDFVKERYPEPADKQALVGTNSEKTEEQFRDYEADARSSVREFYRLNHRGQTLDFVRQKREEYLSLNQREMGVWEAAEFLNTLIDDSDPDTDLSQLEHLLQTSEQIRCDGHPRWRVHPRREKPASTHVHGRPSGVHECIANDAWKCVGVRSLRGRQP